MTPEQTAEMLKTLFYWFFFGGLGLFLVALVVNLLARLMMKKQEEAMEKAREANRDFIRKWGVQPPRRAA